MLLQLIPPNITNDYRGSLLAKRVFMLITVVTLVRSLIHILAPDGGAQTIATIPLDTFGTNAADAVVLAFSLWGLSQLIIGLVYVGVLFRYQSLIPLMYAQIVFEYAMRIVLGVMKPVETIGTAPGAIGNYVLIPLALIMLALSLRQRSTT